MDADAVVRSLRRHSRLRPDKIANDLGLPLSDAQLSLRTLQRLSKEFRDPYTEPVEDANDTSIRAVPAAHEMTDEWAAKEPFTPPEPRRGRPAPHAGSGGTSLAQRRRARYRALPLSVRRVAPAQSGGSALEDAEDEKDEDDDEKEEESVKPSSPQLEGPLGDVLDFHKLSKITISRGAVDYLQLECKLRIAELLCRVITTAEQEYRLKRRSKVWRQDVSKIKPRHIHAEQLVDEQPTDPIPSQHDLRGRGNEAAELIAMLSDRPKGRTAMEEIILGRQDRKLDEMYENVLRGVPDPNLNLNVKHGRPR